VSARPQPILSVSAPLKNLFLSLPIQEKEKAAPRSIFPPFTPPCVRAPDSIDGVSQSPLIPSAAAAAAAAAERDEEA